MLSFLPSRSPQNAYADLLAVSRFHDRWVRSREAEGLGTRRRDMTVGDDRRTDECVIKGYCNFIVSLRKDAILSLD